MKLWNESEPVELALSDLYLTYYKTPFKKEPLSQ